MVTRRGKGTRDVLKDGLSVVINLRSLSMHDSLSSDYASAKNFSDALVAQTDAQDGHLSAELSNDVIRNARLFWCAGAWRDHNPLWFEALDFGYRDLVITVDDGFRPEPPKVLDEIVGEGIIIIDHEQHG